MKIREEILIDEEYDHGQNCSRKTSFFMHESAEVEVCMTLSQ